MARESQALQIALIIFFMLTIVLGVTTFLYHGRYTEALKQAKDYEETANQERRKTANAETECADLKRMVGLAEKSLADIREQYDKDMKTYAMNFPEDARFYSPMLARLWEAIEDKSKDVKALTAKLDDLDTRFKVREAEKDKQIQQFQQAVSRSGEDVTKLTQDFDAQRRQIQEEQKGIQDLITKVRTTSRTRIEEAAREVKVAQGETTRLGSIIRDQGQIIRNLNRPTMDTPSGEIRWVDQRSGVVWINLGRADLLERQISFTVYSADATDLGKATKKATIEVTRIVGDHSAEARIVEDKVSDPIMPGDKIFTPVWTPGERTHFALVGLMNIDGDGRNALGTVRSLITMNGGVVDCEMDENGNKTGDLTAQTRYLVVGDESKSPKEVDTRTKIMRDAERLGIGKMSLTDLKQKMGYRKQTTVERFGREPPTPSTGPRASSGGAKAAPSSGSAKKARPKAKAAADEQ